MDGVKSGASAAQSASSISVPAASSRISGSSSAAYYKQIERYDQTAQLTVSSVNTVLEDLLETDDENDDEDKAKTGRLIDLVSEDAAASMQQRSRHPSDSMARATRQRLVGGSSKRERSPVVSFDSGPATVIELKPMRQRSRSDATRFKFRSPSSSFSSGSPSSSVSGGGSGAAAGVGGGGVGGKLAWLRDRRRSAQIQKVAAEKEKAATDDASRHFPPEEYSTGRDEFVSSLECKLSDPKAAATRKKVLKGMFRSSADLDNPTKRMRPRARSDYSSSSSRRNRPSSSSGPSTPDASRSTFDWPLGRLGKLRQKYALLSSQQQQSGSNKGSMGRSASASNLNDAKGVSGNLKRRNSERQKRSGGSTRNVAFEEQGLASSLWKSSVKYILGKAKGSSSATTRRRHLTDPNDRKQLGA